MLALRFCILGALEVRDSGRGLPLGTGRQRALLALLLTHANELVSSERLIEELWSGRPPPSAQKALQGYVSQLRRALGTDAILTRSSGYVLSVSDTDAAEFERLTRLAGDQDAGKAIRTLDGALALWRGRAFEEFEHEEWAQLEIARLEELRFTATEQRIEAELDLGHHAPLVPELQALVADHPLRERLRGQLMVALYRSGRHADALEVYRRGRQVLRDELGLEPSPFLSELERQILSHDAALRTPARRHLPLRDPRPRRRRRLLAAMVAVAIVAAVAAGLAFSGRGGMAHTVLPNSVVRVDPKTLKATEVAQVGDAPDLVVESGGYLWVTNNILRDSTESGIRNAGDHTLTRVDPSTDKATPVGGGLSPCGLTSDPSGDVWVANCFTPRSGETSSVVRVDARTLTFAESLSVPGGTSYYRGLVWGGGSLWAADDPSGSSPYLPAVTQVDPRARTKRTVRVADSCPCALGWSEGYGDLWVSAFQAGSLTRVHGVTGKRMATDSVATNPSAVVADGDAVWVADWSTPQVVRLSAVRASRPHAVSLPIRNHAACPRISCVWTIAAGAGFIWATTPEDGALWRIDPKTDAVTRVALPYRPAGVTADATTVWVTVRGKS